MLKKTDDGAPSNGPPPFVSPTRGRGIGTTMIILCAGNSLRRVSRYTRSILYYCDIRHYYSVVNAINSSSPRLWDYIIFLYACISLDRYPPRPGFIVIHSDDVAVVTLLHNRYTLAALVNVLR